ncbi:MAG: GatB/YqeY domain-containing protein [Nitrospirae bacterium]|nr:MAG: GatB/YqeY domain-containing protein [Nitrospirota bacterium]
MSLTDRLSDDLKLAMKARDQLRMDAIRMVKAALQNKEIELKKALDEAEMSRVLLTLVKQRKEAAEQYQQGKRQDLADKELKEVAIIQAYLPKALSQDEIVQIVEGAIKETDAAGMKDMGKVMKAAQAKLAGQPVDGKQLSDLVRSKLQQG